MSGFEFAFSLFGLVLGLSITEVISGFARVLRARHATRLGWLTPLLGLLLIVDLVTFWTGAWDVREILPMQFETLLIGTVVAAIYYLSASLVFPEKTDDWANLDDYFMRHKGQVIGGVMAANLIMDFCYTWILGTGVHHWTGIAIPVTFTSLGTILLLARERWTAGIVLCLILSLYVLFRLI